MRDLVLQWYATLNIFNAAVAMPLRDLADALGIPLLSALLFGVIGATSPCQLTTNASALAYVAHGGGIVPGSPRGLSPIWQASPSCTR